MRSFIVALAVLITVFTAVFINSYYAICIYDELLYDTLSLPQSASDSTAHSSVSALCTKADRHADYFFTVLSQQNVNELLYCYSDMLSATISKDDSTYKLSVEKAKLLLKLMKKNEGFPSFITEGKESKKRYFP